MDNYSITLIKDGSNCVYSRNGIKEFCLREANEIAEKEIFAAKRKGESCIAQISNGVILLTKSIAYCGRDRRDNDNLAQRIKE